jgi:hypothetical protein
MKNLFIPLTLFAIAFLAISIIALEHGNNVTCRVFSIVAVGASLINLFDNKNQHNETTLDFRVPGDRICFNLDELQQFRKRRNDSPVRQVVSDG